MPDHNLGVGAGTNAFQTAEIMRHFEPVVLKERPDFVAVYGDVNSTLAACIVCSKRLIPLTHVESGLRSFDRTMPDEINRFVTDRLANLLFTPYVDGSENLLYEGVERDCILLVGNAMIDTLVRLLLMAEQRAYRTTRSERRTICACDSPPTVKCRQSRSTQGAIARAE